MVTLKVSVLSLRNLICEASSDECSLRSQNSTGQGAMYFHIHIWVHTILSHSIIPPLEPSHDIPQGLSNLDGKTGVITPIDQLCRSGAKLIGEYLTLCTVVNPGIYQTHPFLGQPLFTAGMVIMKGQSMFPLISSDRVISLIRLKVISERNDIDESRSPTTPQVF